MPMRRNRQDDEVVTCLDVFRLLCCPPFPRRISEKLAFNPPTPPYYTMAATDSPDHPFDLELDEEADDSGMKFVIQQSSRLIRTSRGNHIAILYMKCTRTKRFTIIYSHGNSADIGLLHRLCVELSRLTKCDVVTYDYSGYGESSGTPTERNMYADIRAVWDYTAVHHEPDPLKVVLYGQSLGTAAAVDLAAQVRCAGVILQSPLTSAMRVGVGRFHPRCMDSLLNIEKAPKISAPVLVIHGTQDEIVAFSHGLAIYGMCPRTVAPLWLKGAGHNDIELYGEYSYRLVKFIDEELPFNTPNTP